MEERLARLEGMVEQMDKRLTSIESRLNHLESRLESLESELSRARVELSEKVDRNFRWTVGIMLGTLIPMWVTIILAILLGGA